MSVYKEDKGRQYHIHYERDKVYMWAEYGGYRYVTATFFPADKFDPEQGAKDVDLAIEERENT